MALSNIVNGQWGMGIGNWMKHWMKHWMNGVPYFQRNPCWWHKYCECSSMSVQSVHFAAWNPTVRWRTIVGFLSGCSARARCYALSSFKWPLNLQNKSIRPRSYILTTLAGFLPVSAAKYRPEMSEASPHATWEFKAGIGTAQAQTGA